MRAVLIASVFLLTSISSDANMRMTRLSAALQGGTALASFASADNPMMGQAPGAGSADIPTTDHDVMRDLMAAWGNGAIPGSNAPDVVGAFRFICRHTNLASDDPTVFPGQPGKSHLHDQTGVSGWNAYSNYVNLREHGGGSGCNDVAGADHDLAKSSYSGNRTPYWQPALLDGKGNVILADYTSFYYKARPFAGPLADPVVSDPTSPHFAGRGVPLPNGIKFIFGAFPENPNKAPVPEFIYGCIDPSGHPVLTGKPTFAQAVQCVKTHNATGTGYQLEVHETAPNCWDGSHLDSADHRSHLSYGRYVNGAGKCPAGYPYVIPAFTYSAFYTILPTDDGDIHFSSDEMDNSRPRGWSFHVDYGPAAWDPTILKMWTENCINKKLNCSGGDLGNGKQLKGAAEPIYHTGSTWVRSWRIPNRLVPVARAGAS